MKKVVVTGGSGLLGTWVLKEFVSHGYQVLNADVKKPEENICDTVIVDLTDLGEVYGALQGADAVVHLAAIPVAYSHPNEVTFRNNTLATYNVLEAAAGLGIKNAVLASSESSYGICFAKERFDPQYVPIDEAHPQLPEDSYGLSKIVNEETAKMMHRRTGMQVVSFRLGNVIAPPMYQNFPSFIHDASQRDRILWSYIDTRDAAAACRLAVEKQGLGAVELNLAGDDTSMDIPSRDLMKAEFPNVPIKENLGEFESLLNSDKAKELLGWKPVHFWRDNVKIK
jgi:nucleoside-diphosphate-sugar epimerase